MMRDNCLNMMGNTRACLGGLLAALWVFVAPLGLAWSAETDLTDEEAHTGLPVEIVYFYMDGCPACTQAQAILDELEERYPQLQVLRYRLPTAAGREVLDVLRDAYQLGDISIPVPTMFVGEVAIVGRVFYGLTEEPVSYAGAAWALGIEQAVQRAVDDGDHFVLRYCDSQLGFCMGYPLDWSFTPPHGGTVVFSGSEDTKASRSGVTVQGFTPTALGNGSATVADLIVRYKYGIVLVSPSLHIDSTAYPDGDGYVAEYILPTGAYRQWRVAVAHNDVLLSWAYTAPADVFDAYHTLAEAMLATWRFNDDG